jgi:hypothetical protein
MPSGQPVKTVNNKRPALGMLNFEQSVFTGGFRRLKMPLKSDAVVAIFALPGACHTAVEKHGYCFSPIAVGGAAGVVLVSNAGHCLATKRRQFGSDRRSQRGLRISLRRPVVRAGRTQ